LGDYAYRVMNAALGSEAFLRTKVMRAMGFAISSKATIWAGASFRSKQVSIGPGVFINVGFYHDGYDMLEIGENVRIGPFVRIVTATHDIGPAHQRGLIEVVGKPVAIKAGCWIGTGVLILPGVTIAPGCVIGAHAVMHDSTEPNGVYAGNPARRVRELEP
jgi:maltose O-acetyltransferase